MTENVQPIGEATADGLPRYRSHKIVRAAPILRFGRDPGEVVLDVPGGEVTLLLPPGIFARARPVAGDYIVIYEGGYASWSPKIVFEGGYTVIEE